MGRFLFTLSAAAAALVLQHASARPQEAGRLPWERPPSELDIEFNSSAEGTELIFDWRLPVAAAVFQRDSALWIVFDEPATIDVEALQNALAGRMNLISAAADSRASVFRFATEGALDAAAARQGNRWRISFGPPAAGRIRSISLDQVEHRERGVRLFVPLEQPGLLLRLRDPAGGRPIHVLPLFAPGRAVAANSEFSGFSAPQTAQGLVLADADESIEVARYANGLLIGTRGLPAGAAAPLPAGANVISVMDRPGMPSRMIDLAAWKLGTLADFAANQRMLNRRLAVAPQEMRNLRRWDLARFYLAHVMYREARAYLDVMAENDPAWAGQARYQAVRSLVELGLGNTGRALELIASPRLDPEPEVALWRARILIEAGEPAAGLAMFESARPALALIVPGEAAAMRMSAMDAALRLGRLGSAVREDRVLRNTPLDESQAAMAQLLRGRLKLAEGAIPEARALLASVADSGIRPAAGRARLALIEAKLNRGEMAPDAAAEDLERLRLAWRGDPFELEIAERLGRIHFGQGELRAGLLAMRRAVAEFPGHPRTEALTHRMRAAFEELFTQGTLDDLEALETVALYREFRELTPLGAEGDRILRQLAERLVALDLLGPAAGLLQHQLRYRASDRDRPGVANRLAEILIADRRPEEAIAVLDQTALGPMPPATDRALARTRAAALIALGRLEEAEAGLRGDRGPEAESLRAEIYWRAGRLEEFVRSGARLLEPLRRADGVPGPDDRLLLVRQALALEALGERQGLIRLGRDFAGRLGDDLYSTAFALLTGPLRGSGRGLRELVTTTASVNLFEQLLDHYRADSGAVARDPVQP